MILKLFIVAAALTFSIGIAWLLVNLGIRIGKTAVRHEQSYIDPDTYHELGNLTRALLAPPATVEDFVVLPEAMQAEAKRLIKKIGSAPRYVRN
jgi:hypothetical protein